MWREWTTCMKRRAIVLLEGLLLAGVVQSRLSGAEGPYFITYNHHMEEPGSLEVEVSPLVGPLLGGPREINGFAASTTEFEYGVKGWWTSEIYLDSQSTRRDSTLFTGFRLENRLRPLMDEHWINPVLYVEFENTTDADKTLKEVVGFDEQLDAAEPNSTANQSHTHEIETKLILSSDYKGWNFSENFIAEKNLGHEPWEFGYALGISRPLRLAATPRPCNFCRENFILGAEAYGGLGTTDLLALSGTSHYIASIVAWQMPSGVTLSVSPGLGLTDVSHRFLLRWGMSYEIGGFGRKLRSLF
jgi:hypothetical protein